MIGAEPTSGKCGRLNAHTKELHWPEDGLLRDFLRDKYSDRFDMESEIIVRYFLDWDNDGGIHISAMGKNPGRDMHDADHGPTSSEDLANLNTSLEHHCQVLVASHPRHAHPGVEWDHTPGVVRKMFVVWPVINGVRGPAHYLSLVDLYGHNTVSLEYLGETAWGVGVVSNEFVRQSHLNIIPVHRFMGTFMSQETTFKRKSLLLVSPFVHSVLPPSGDIRY